MDVKNKTLKPCPFCGGEAKKEANEIDIYMLSARNVVLPVLYSEQQKTESGMRKTHLLKHGIHAN